VGQAVEMLGRRATRLKKRAKLAHAR
jgi:hypothetical protein